MQNRLDLLCATCFEQSSNLSTMDYSQAAVEEREKKENFLNEGWTVLELILLFLVRPIPLDAMQEF